MNESSPLKDKTKQNTHTHTHTEVLCPFHHVGTQQKYAECDPGRVVLNRIQPCC